ncbi:MAG: aconitate hydratase AcnA [Thermoplasmata archaeon]
MKGPSSVAPTEEIVVAGERSTFYPVDAIPRVDRSKLSQQPLTTRILLENVLRHFDPSRTSIDEVRRLAEGRPDKSERDLPFFPSRVLLQDFTGVPVLVDLTAVRSAAAQRGVDAAGVNPRIPVDLIVDHSVQVDSFGQRNSILINLDHEYDRNSERYALLRWGQGAYENFSVVPPGNGICHQVNLEYLSRVVERRGSPGHEVVFPDTLIGTDSHTTMVNGLSVLGWGVGGIEAEAVVLGEPYYLPFPDVVGVRLDGAMPEGATATDLVLTVTRELRKKGVVEKFVEFTGPGITNLSVPDRATISNMCPEYGATAALFPIDGATLAYLRGTGRPAELVARVEAYARRQGFWWEVGVTEPHFADHVNIDLDTIVPTVSGPKNPEEAVALSELPRVFGAAREKYRKLHPRPSIPAAPSPTMAVGGNGGGTTVPDGAAVIAAITSCTNTSNPTVMVGAGLIARRARERGMHPAPYVKTSLAPGSKVVTEYLRRADLIQDLDALGFELVGYGCTTCIGNSGPLLPEAERAVREEDAYVAAVLSGNRNFEARIHNQVRANFLASPMLVVAFALAGRVDIDLTREPVGKDSKGAPVYLRDLWPKNEEVRQLVERSLDPSIFVEKYRSITQGDFHWESLDVPAGRIYPWRGSSTYVRDPPYFELERPPVAATLVQNGRALAILGDGVSTDHISPAGEIPEDSPAGQYLIANGVPVAQFNTYGTRRGNHEVMVRGTFGNVRLANQLVAPREGGWTMHVPSGNTMTIYDASLRYRDERVPLVVLGGSNYGQGSSRDWAAKGPRLLGVRAVLVKNFERIHRSNLVGMGVLPLEFQPGEGTKELGLTGRETFTIAVPQNGPIVPRGTLDVMARDDSGSEHRFTVRCRINSPVELDYYRAGGLLPYVLERLVASASKVT